MKKANITKADVVAMLEDTIVTAVLAIMVIGGAKKKTKKAGRPSKK